MSWLRYFRRGYWDRERSRELQAYLEIETDENIARGMPPEEARYAARRKLGNPTQIREEIYHMNSIGFLETLWKDLRYGARLLRLNPGFASVAILSLALGIGANTAILQLINAVVLRTLPVENPQELAEVRISNVIELRGSTNSTYAAATYSIWQQIREHQQAFSGTFAWSDDEFNLAPRGEARVAHGIWVSGDFFQVLGVKPFLGRVFSAADDRRGCGLAGVVISYPFWQREFGGSSSVLGRKITIEHHPVDVIGVTAQGFAGLEVGRSFDVALPICAQPALTDYSFLDDGTIWWLTVMGRLKPGWAMNRASAHLSAISPGIFQTTLPPNYPRVNVNEYLSYKLTASPAGRGVSVLRNYYSDPLKMLLAIAGLVLLIACANLANLMLARASAREREIALRLALGASRGRLIRQLLAESLLLAASGALLGTLLAGSLSQALVSLISTEGNRWFLDLALDWRVLGFTAGVGALTCVLFGLVPALRATSSAPGAMVKSGGRGITSSRERFSLRRVLVVSQIALSLVLLVSALLFSRSLQHLMALDAGFQQDGILIADTDITALRLPVARWDEFKQSVLDRIAAIPGVDAVADVKFVPLSGSVADDHVWLDGSEEKIDPYFNWISPGYFKTLATPFLAGRDFDAHDTRTSPKVAIVNEAFARRLGIPDNAISKRFRREATPSEPEIVFEIVGLVKNAKYRDLRENFTPTIFFPSPQLGSPEPGQHILIRSSAPPAGLVASVKRTLGEVNPEMAYFFSFFKTRIRDGLLRERLMATLSGFFGALAALLAATGLYGVISYMVARRTNEIGIRMALGADRRDVVKMILREGGWLLVFGVAGGSVLALTAATTARSMLFGLQPYDPATLGMAIALLAVVTLAASYLPARRAAKLDPMTALRDE
jgi:predicted permease